jgi:hypothetical protein
MEMVSSSRSRERPAAEEASLALAAVSMLTRAWCWMSFIALKTSAKPLLIESEDFVDPTQGLPAMHASAAISDWHVGSAAAGKLRVLQSDTKN